MAKNYGRRKASKRCFGQGLTAIGLAVTVAVTLAGCANDGSVDIGGEFLGAVAADEPRAALVGRDVLAAGGTATDAAVATFFSLAVTLPSSAGLWSTGSCVVLDPARKRYEKIAFGIGPTAPSAGNVGALTLPQAPRAMNILHARYGRVPIQNLLVKSEQLARWGSRVSRQLANDVQAHQAILGPKARQLFQPAGQNVPLSTVLKQSALADILAQLRAYGIDDLYEGALARRLVAAAKRENLQLDGDALRQAVPAWTPVTGLRHVNQTWVMTSPSIVTEQRLNAVLKRLSQDENWTGRSDQGRLKALYAAHVADDRQPVAADRESAQDRAGSSAFWALDAAGQAVGCAISLGRAFGGGYMLGETGLFALRAGDVAAGSSNAAVLMVGNTLNWQSHMIAVGSGGPAAGDALIAVALDHFTGEMALKAAIDRPRQAVISARQIAQEAAITASNLPPEVLNDRQDKLARVRAIHCFEGLPRYEFDCVVGDDQRGAGLVVFEQK